MKIIGKIVRAALLLVLTAGSVAAAPIVGRATVIDADTLDIRGQRIRLHGIDSPESAQLCQDAADKSYRCGKEAAFALADKIGTRPVSCTPKDRDRYGRVVAVCRLGRIDLNGWLVEQGHALAYRKYGTAYSRRETRARRAKRGLWAGTFQPPWEWRAQRRARS